jgi:hypothetical protein
MPKPSPMDVFGKGDVAAEDTSDEEMAPDMGADDEVPPDFQSAYDEYEADPTASTMYRMIEACKGGGADMALLIGSGKSKKS